MPEICSPTRSSARRTAASGERVACSSATSWLVLLNVGVDGQPVIAAQRDGKVGVHGGDRVVGQRLAAEP